MRKLAEGLLRAVVAIPAKDEAMRLPSCLDALRRQRRRPGRTLGEDAFGVVVFANNCRDDTAATARRMRNCEFQLRVVEARLRAEISHAGGARRAAMDLAARWLQESGNKDAVILTTDADSRVAPDWLAANLDAFAQGADAVLGRISLDEEGASLPPLLHARGKLEAVYEDLLTEIAARLDREEANPWPHHATISGASLGVRLDMYLRAGGMPRVPLGEDKAFVAELRRLDARIRFDSDVHVVTSGRVVGRAPGGVADTLQLRSHDPNALCDEALEPCAIAFKRALWRGRLRRAGLATLKRWPHVLRVPASAAARALANETFGAAWEEIERSSLTLAPRRLSPADLPQQIGRATRALRLLQARLTPDENIDSILRALNCVDLAGEGLDAGDEELGGLVAT